MIIPRIDPLAIAVNTPRKCRDGFRYILSLSEHINLTSVHEVNVVTKSDAVTHFSMFDFIFYIGFIIS